MRDDELLLRRFLLGELAEDEAERLERRLLQEEEVQEEGGKRFTLFDLCEAVEGDLLNADARGELTSAESEGLRKRLAASAGGRARIALARTLAGYPEIVHAEPAPLPFPQPAANPPRRTFRWMAMAAGLVFAAASGSWLWMSHSPEPASPGGNVTTVGREVLEPRSPREAAPADPAPPAAPERTAPKEAQALAERSAPPEPAPVPDRPAPEPAPRLAPAVFQLAVSTLRSDEPPERLGVPKGTGEIEIQLDLGGEEETYRTFNALVRSSGAGEVWSRQGLEPKPLDWGTALILEIPAKKLPDGKYEMEVQGVTAQGEAERIGIREFEIFEIAAD